MALLPATLPPAPLEHITMFKVRSLPFGQVDRVAIEIAPRPGYHFYARDPGELGEATTIGWTGGDGAVVEALPVPTPQKMVDGGIASWMYNGLTTFQAKLQGNRDGTVIAKIHLAVCGNACFPIDYIIDRPVDALPVHGRFDSQAFVLAVILAAVLTAAIAGQRIQNWLSKLTFVQKRPSWVRRSIDR